MSEDRFDPQEVRTECGKVDAGEYHVYPDICKCEYDKKEQKRKQINELAKGSLNTWGDIRPNMKQIMELSNDN